SIAAGEPAQRAPMTIASYIAASFPNAAPATSATIHVSGDSVLLCRSENLPHVLRREEFRDRHRTGEGAEQAVRLLLIATKGTEKLLHFRRWRREVGELHGRLETRPGLLVALALVRGERIRERLATGKARVHRLHQEFDIAESI